MNDRTKRSWLFIVHSPKLNHRPPGREEAERRSRTFHF